MDPNKIRQVYAPYSTSGEQVGQTPLTGYVDVAQAIYPAVNTGQISTDGEWSGVIVSDKNFIAFTRDEAIANGGDFLTPQQLTDKWPLDMTGYTDLQIAIKPTNTGSYSISAVMGPDTNNYANLNPVNSAAALRGNIQGLNTLNSVLLDSGETCTADVWNIFYIAEVLKNQKLLQFKITNNSGGESTVETAYMRVV